MKVKFLKAGVAIGMGYFENDVADLPEKQVYEIVSLGYGITDFEVEKPEIIVDLPDDMPGRTALLKADVKTMAELYEFKKIGFELTDLQGIGKALAKQIYMYLDLDSNAK